MMEMSYCNECLEGKQYPPCPRCEGRGELLDGHECPICHGVGESEPIECPDCAGTGEVPRPFAKLKSAHKRVDDHCRVRGEKWGGDDADHPGVTDYSLAKWWRERWGFRVMRVQALVADDDTHIIVLTREDGMQLRFAGFSWGYGGEGPSGLAVVLADAGLFESIEDAMRFVSHKPMHKPWTYERGRVEA